MLNSSEDEDGDKSKSFVPGVDELHARKSASSQKSTPSKRRDGGLTKADRFRIDSAHIQPPKCLIALTSDRDRIVLSHMIPAATSPRTVGLFSWSR